jgi:DNA-binding CsgD family transcriptional regulator
VVVEAVGHSIATSHRSVVTLAGVAGSGKTTLLGAAVAHIAQHTVRATCMESEQTVAWSTLHRLLAPLHEEIKSIPEHLGRHLRRALTTEPGQCDPGLVCVALFQLLVSQSDATPLIIAIDDAQWIDIHTLTAVTFAVSRLDAEPIAVVVCGRAVPAVIAAMADEHIELAALSAQQSAEVLAELADGHTNPHDLIERAGGNPLTLVELARASQAGTLIPAHSRLADLFVRRIEALPPRTRVALLAIAMSAPATVEHLMSTLAACELDLSDLAAAELDGLFRVYPQPMFEHPVVAVFAVDHATAAQRSRLAGVLARSTSAPQRRAQLLDVCLDADASERSDAWCAAAEWAASIGAHGDAARNWQRAADLSSDAHSADTCRTHAVDEALRASEFLLAFELLMQQHQQTPDPQRRLRLAARRAQVETWMRIGAFDPPTDAQIAEWAAVSAPAAATLLSCLATQAYTSGRMRAALSLARRGAALNPDDLGAAFTAELIGFVAGEEPTSLLSVPWETMIDDDTLSGVDMPIGLATTILLWCDQTDRAESILDRMVAHQQRHGAADRVAAGLSAVVELYATTGRWRKARAAASLADGLRQPNRADSAGGLMVLARLHAACGEAASMEAAIGRMRSIVPQWNGVFRQSADTAAGLLALGTGQLDRSIDVLSSTQRMCAEDGVLDPAMRMADTYLVEALWRTGRTEEAGHAAAEFSALAERTQRASSLALARRGEALVADDFEALFAQSLAFDDKVSRPFERARTLLCLGERRRRAKRRRDAQVALAEALTIFAPLDATPWIKRCETELALCGRVNSVGRGIAWTSLTGQELQVAVAAAEGSSNKAIAAQLFVSRRTVEYHLQNVYRKLGVSSRSRLAAHLGNLGTDSSV